MNEFYIAVAGSYWVWAMFGTSVLLTAVHAIEEVDGKGGPLWSEFGRIAGVRVSPNLGFLGVVVFLPFASIVAATLGYVNGLPLWASILCGIRLGDTLFSHVGLVAIGLSIPNPGIYSSLFFVVEGSLILYLWETLSWPVVLFAAAPFAVVLPLLILLRSLGVLLSQVR